MSTAHFITCLVATSISFAIGIAALYRSYQKKEKGAEYYFGLLNICVSFLNISDVVIYLVPGNLINIAYRLSQPFTVLVVPAFIRFVETVKAEGKVFQSGKHIRFVILMAYILAPLALTPLVIAKVQLNPFQEIRGALFYLVEIYFLYGLCLGVSHLVQGLKTATGQTKQQLKYIIVSFCIGAIAAGTYIFGGGGDITTTIALSLEIIYTLFLAYTVFRYKFLNLDVWLKAIMAFMPCVLIPMLTLIPNNFRIITATLAAILSFSLGFLAYFKNQKSPVNRYFAFFSFNLGLWNTNELSVLIPSHDIVLMVYRFSYIGGSFIVSAFMNFMIALAEESSEVKIRFKFRYANITGLIFAVLSLTPLIIKDISYDPVLLTPVIEMPGLLYPIFALLFVSVLFYSLYPLIIGLKRATGIKRNQMKYAMVTVVLGATAATVYFGTMITPKIPPIHYVLQMVMTTTFAVAIIHSHLMDITLLTRDAMVQILVAITSAAAVLLVGIWFIPARYIIWIILMGLTIAVLTPTFNYRLKGKYESFVDKYVFQNRWNYHKKLQDIGDKAFSIYSLKELLDTVTKDVAAALGTDTCYALIREGRTDTFELWAETGLNDELHDKCMKVEEGNNFIKALVKRKKVLVKEDLVAISVEDNNKDVVKAMEERGCAVVVPLYFNEKLNGVLALGLKTNRRMYTHKDVELLEKLSRDVSHAYGFLSIIYDQALLTARTAHDAKQPLSGAGYRLMNILNGLYGRGSDREKEELMDVKERVLFVGEFFSDLMELNNIIRLRLRGDYKFAAYDMAELLRFIVEGLKPVAQGKGLGLRLLCPEDLPKGLGVSSSVQRVLSNLITNSIKFTTEGFVEVTACRDGEHIEVKITDTGSGMSEEDVKNLFVPFHKIGGKKNFVEGAGLGLTIVKEVLEAHKGKIKVKSELGKGTEFVVSLPALLEEGAHGNQGNQT